MNRKVTVVGAGNVGATLAQRIADRELADVVLIDIIEGMPQGKGLDIMEATPVEGSDARVVGTNDYKDTAGLGHRGHHRRHRPQARDEPRRPAQHQLQDRQGVHRERGQALAERDPDDRLQPARRHVPGGLQGLGLPQAPGLRHGGRPGLGPHADLHRDGAGRLGREHAAPSCWAATATRWCRCRATPRCAASPSPSCCRPRGSRRS